MSEELCKGGCGEKAVYRGWCKIKWKSGNKFAVGCPVIEKRRGKSISIYRIKEARLGKNPMQNPLICAKNHSDERNKKCSLILREKGRLKILPQQIESPRLKEKRRKNVCKSLKKLWEEGKHHRQLETKEQRRKRFEKISKTISKKIKVGEITPPFPIKKVKYKGIRFRSNWERIIAKLLDKYSINWEYETLRVPYKDTERNMEAWTIPDFYLPSTNTIIEVKGRWLDSKRTKDKILGIKEKGLSIIMIGEKEIDIINKNPEMILKFIEEK